MEKAGKEYNLQIIKNMIEAQKNKENCEFLFLGADINAISTAKFLGIDSNRTYGINLIVSELKIITKFL